MYTKKQTGFERTRETNLILEGIDFVAEGDDPYPTEMMEWVVMRKEGRLHVGQYWGLTQCNQYVLEPHLTYREHSSESDPEKIFVVRSWQETPLYIPANGFVVSRTEEAHWDEEIRINNEQFKAWQKEHRAKNPVKRPAVDERSSGTA